MKLITLNTWGGRIGKPFLKFIKDHSDIDIFCFQEMNNDASEDIIDPSEDKDLFSAVQKILPHFDGYFSLQVYGTGMAVFIKKTHKIDAVESHLILSKEEIDHYPDPFPRVMQSVHFGEIDLTIYNFHGVPKADKKDIPVRDLQTERVINIIEKNKDHKIIVGDFNLNPDTKSISKFESMFTNQVKENNIQTTRSNFYEWKKSFPFADYIFTSPELVINEFKVLPEEISDHLALYIDLQQ